MAEKVLCPFHQERSPSCVIYDDGFYHSYCCGRHGPISELGRATEAKPGRVKFVEDLTRTVPAIQALPKREIRGLELHASDTGYYILWHDLSYYKYRPFTVGDARSKYKGPSGVSKPLFQAANEFIGGECVVIEGELNALSLAKARPDLTVVSPGGAGDFYSKRTAGPDLSFYKRYSHLWCVVDEDPAGAMAAIQFKSLMVAAGIEVTIRMMKVDANDLLVKEGPNGLKEEAARMGLRVQMRHVSGGYL